MLHARLLGKLALLAGLTGTAVTGLATSSFADDTPRYTTSVVRTPNSPVVLTYCNLHNNPYAYGVSTNLTNRSDRFLTQYEVRWTFYDHSNLAIGQTDTTYDVPSLAPADKYTHEQQIIFSLSESVTSIARATCRLQSAKFEGGRVWQYGRAPWKGHLSALS